MRYLAWSVSLWLFPLAVWADPVLVCERPDASLAVVAWATTEHRVPDDMAALACTTMERSTLPTSRIRREAWRVVNGQVKPDATVETPREAAGKTRAQARAKLKALGLTDAEVALIAD